jgi:GGDEF domain-containing protein
VKRFYYIFTGGHVTQDELIKLLKRILGTEIDLDFLARLGPEELEILVACVRDRLAQVED